MESLIYFFKQIECFPPRDQIQEVIDKWPVYKAILRFPAGDQCV